MLTGLLALGGCGYYVDSGENDVSPEVDPVEESFNTEVLPLLDQNCGTCHGGQRAFIDFLVPREPESQTVLEAVLQWPGLIDVDEPSNSRLFTKGVHEGAAWTPAELDRIAAWLAENF